LSYNYWEKDLNSSVVALESIRHTVLPKLISGKIHTIEKVNNDILMLLDQKSGIDYIREDETGLQGIAARCQWGTKAWNSFTIRSERHTGSKTELEKRMESIEKGYFYPAYTLQAYFDDRKTNNLYTIGVIKTKDLFGFMRENPDFVETNKSDNKFVYVEWQFLRKVIKTFPKIEILYPQEVDYV
jgi:hypothetical protein